MMTVQTASKTSFSVVNKRLADRFCIFSAAAILVACTFLSLPASAKFTFDAQAPKHSPAQQQFEQLIFPLLPPQSQVSILAIDTNSNEILLDKQADTLLIPASTQKVLTAVTALATFGQDYRYETQLLTDAPVRQGQITGDLYLKFSGDPTLLREDLNALFSSLTQQGIHRINGNVVLVGDKEEQLQAPGWVWDDLGICFAAPVSRFIIDQNCVYGEFVPQQGKTTANKPAAPTAKVKLRASSSGVKVDNDATYSSQTDDEFCKLILFPLGQNRYQLRGCYSHTQALPLAIAVTDPQKFAKDSVQALLKMNGLTSGQIKIGTHLPVKTQVIASHRSAPLTELLETMLLKSDNLIADSLFKLVGERHYHSQATFERGAAAMREILTELGIDLNSANIVDGSGLSRYNLLSAAQLAQVLTLIDKDPRFKALKQSLPESGVSGTLKYRFGFTTPPLKHKVLAKTGSMQGVSNLAGFLHLVDSKPAETNHPEAHQNREIIFVILENGISPERKKASPRTSLTANVLSAILKGMPMMSAAKANTEVRPTTQTNPIPKRKEKILGN
ncbi:D-alanyl-D-alanine carboxypeptidase/D-alanyl-D-alanine-endopeptidase [Shewanella sp. A25]|nr:D-alanyl-D-alanine carboxypeptidase/D-alanyl-D-alanine-endopeptidase [Shewanella shenzhenensis]